MRRKRFSKTKVDTKIIMDVGLAGLVVRVLPMVVNKFVPLEPMIYTAVGAGGTYVVGSMMKKPVLANAGIAYGLVEVVAPMVEELIGGFVGTAPVVTAPVGGPSGVKVSKLPAYKMPAVDSLQSYNRLNEYVPIPTMRYNTEYRDSY